MHIYALYLDLLGLVGEEYVVHLSGDTWSPECGVGEEENNDLMRTFMAEELDDVMLSMKKDTAPWPESLPVIFFKRF